ncbi:MAG: class I SAM-dependent methyltransferase [Candidatus Nanoarchaeia archaeon]
MKKHPWVEAERKFYENNFDEFTKGLDFSSYKTVLDYGSGTGGYASILAEKHPHLKVIAVDSNPKAIDLAKQNYSHLSNLEFKLSEKLPEGEFDLINYHLVLHELDGKENKDAIKRYLKEAHSKLKEGGRISVLDNKKISKKDFREVYDKNKDPRKGSFEEEYEEHNRYTLDDWREMFKGAGFKTEHEQELPPNSFRYIGIKN